MGTWHTFNNYGYMLHEVPKSVMDALKVEREKYRVGVPVSRHMNKRLVGQIDKEHDVTYLKSNPEVMDFLYGVANEYARTFNTDTLPKEVIGAKSNVWGLELDTLWMNIQQRGEYNPTHAHRGIISFVIWFEIPYYLSEENGLNNAAYSNSPCNADFMFHPIDTVGRLNSISMQVDRNKEGTICVFHAQLLHSVNPFFTTDEQRVTFSGNFVYKEQLDV